MLHDNFIRFQECWWFGSIWFMKSGCHGMSAIFRMSQNVSDPPQASHTSSLFGRLASRDLTGPSGRYSNHGSAGFPLSVILSNWIQSSYWQLLPWCKPIEVHLWPNRKPPATIRNLCDMILYGPGAATNHVSNMGFGTAACQHLPAPLGLEHLSVNCNHSWNGHKILRGGEWKWMKVNEVKCNEVLHEKEIRWNTSGHVWPTKRVAMPNASKALLQRSRSGGQPGARAMPFWRSPTSPTVQRVQWVQRVQRIHATTASPEGPGRLESLCWKGRVKPWNLYESLESLSAACFLSKHVESFRWHIQMTSSNTDFCPAAQAPIVSQP